MDFIKHILSRGLPKTGQDILAAPGDDGICQAGWWVKRKIANNRTRFIAKTIDGDVVVFDRATGLCWAGDGNEAGCNNGATLAWGDAIIYANILDFAGFTDWRVPNKSELYSLVNHSIYSPSIAEPPFSNTASGYYWSSTTRADITTKVWRVDFACGFVSTPDKINSEHLRCVRKGL